MTKPIHHLIVCPCGDRRENPLGWMHGLGAVLRDLGHEVTVLDATLARSGDWADVLSASLRTALAIEAAVSRGRFDVIDAPDCPEVLHVFLSRRALGLATAAAAAPPCVVHVIEPAALVAEANEEDAAAPRALRSARLQEHVLHAADALVAPGQDLARRVESLASLEGGAVSVLSVGAIGRALVAQGEGAPLLPASASPTPADGRVLFLGDLEPRRGAIDWAWACVLLARRRPGLRFEFVGQDGPYAPYRDRSVRERILSIVPPDFQERFALPAGPVARREALARAQLVACPSRIGGFVPECFEAMAAGRPVVVTPALAEYVADSVTGFVLPAGAPAPEAWADAVEAILNRPATELAAVGERAARAMTEPLAEAERQALEAFYGQVVARGTVESRRLPACLPGPGRSSRRHRGAAKLEAGGTPAPQSEAGGTPAPQLAGGTPAPQSARGIAIVVTCYNLGAFLPECLASLSAQTQAPVRTVVVDDGSTELSTLYALRRAEADGWTVVRRANGGLVAARNTGIDAVRAAGDEAGAYVFLDADDRLRPRYAEVCSGILERCPEVGLVSCWTHHFGAADALWARPSPAFPYQWVSNGAATFSAVRAEALREAGGFRPAMDRGYEDWDLFNAVLAAGWVGVTAPEVLGDYRVREDSMLRSFSAHAHGRMRRLMLERFPDEVARDAVAVALLSEAEGTWGMREELLALRAHAARHRAWLRRPDQAVLWFLRRALRRGKGSL